jgi:hypothetical protein
MASLQTLKWPVVAMQFPPTPMQCEQRPVFAAAHQAGRAGTGAAVTRWMTAMDSFATETPSLLAACTV